MSLPELTTRRLVLRPLQKGDAEAIEKLAGRDFEVARWMTSFSWPYEEGSAQSFIEHVLSSDPMTNEAVFAITLGGVVVGVVGLEAPGDVAEARDCPTIGYWLGRPFHGFGYASEAVSEVIAWGFSMFDCPAIAARVFEDNSRSRALLRKLGFKPIGTTVRFAKALDRKVDNIVVQLPRTDFEKPKAAA